MANEERSAVISEVASRFQNTKLGFELAVDAVAIAEDGGFLDGMDLVFYRSADRLPEVRARLTADYLEELADILHVRGSGHFCAVSDRLWLDNQAAKAA